MHVLPRQVWYEPRPAHAPARVWRDWALVAAILIGAALEALLRTDIPRAVAVPLTVALAPTVLWRRTRPLSMLTIAFAGTALALLLTHGRAADTYTSAYLLTLPYALTRWGSGREIVLGNGVVLARLAVWAVAGSPGPGQVAGGAAVAITVMAVGSAVRYRARARAREADRARLVERERLARDLHDTVAHHVSAMAIRAQAGLAVAGTQPDLAVDSLRVIEGEASRALAEMRALVRVLRHDEPAGPVDLSPGPTVADVRRLAGRPDAGPEVAVDIRGPVDDLPPSVATTVFRLAQESVTNARRHARRATRIDVRVTADRESVRLLVTDDGETRPPGRPSGYGPSGYGPSGYGPPGYGLVGMAERAGLLGGTCEAGPNPDRGWTVRAVLPRTGSTP